ncbi:DUF2293 domain-containing protein, partial [Planctomycetota bacterium]
QHRIREADRRTELDLAYIERFAEAVRQLYPKCPPETARFIAEHACTKYSGRVGRSAAAKALDEHAVRLAVVAHVRHAKTQYDSLLMNGWERVEARLSVEDVLRSVLAKWQGNAGS